MAVDVNEFDGIQLNVLGVEDLVNSDTNKSKLGVYTNLEGKSGDEVDLLSLDMDEEELLKLAKEREIQYAGYEARIRPIQQLNKSYYLGKQDKSNQTPLAGNLLFEAVETFLAAALSKNPEPVVYSDNTEAGNQLSSDIKTMLQYHAKTLVLRKKLAAMVRQWTINHLGVLKYGWDDEIQEVKLEIRKIQNFIFDPNGSVDAYGYLAVIDQRAEVASLPLAVRAPEIGELLARLPRGEWGSGELGTLANWLAEHGYDIGDEEEVMTMTDDYTGYKPCGHPEYRNTDAGPQPNDCGCDQGDSDN